uniref:RE1 silencing transcription factor n=1 Tax=Sphenodon punctatus TaxID=8508 RepID=A0A8D0HQE2_SPHPU
MATQVLGQSGGNVLFPGNTNIGMALSNDMYDLHELSKAELAAPQLIMLANVALTGEVNGNCCDYLVGEEKQMAELTTVGDNNFIDIDGEGMYDIQVVESTRNGSENMELTPLESPAVTAPVQALSSTLNACSLDREFPLEAPFTPESAEDKSKSLKSKPFRCKPCHYEAESEEEFIHHIRIHSAQNYFVAENAEKQTQVKESDSGPAEDADFSKGPIRCDRCGYNTNRYDHYLAHLKHHNKAGENERVYKCTICTYTTVSEYHWKKHLRNHFPRKVYTCLQCSYFSDRKNNYIQHIRTHTGERPYRCTMCVYSSSQKTHLTRHMRTHSGEKPFKCDQCNYVASNQHEVTRHARQVHNGPKPLTCPHCEYKTADRSNFKKHVELHVNPRQFLCPVCDYAASKKCNLQYHLKSRHSDCSDVTMDVSKVRLRSKKNETDAPESLSDKVDKEQIKKELNEKKIEKSVKMEKKETLSKEKKTTSSTCAGQVTTRSRKSASKNKEVDIKTEESAEKLGKTKKAKRKAEAESISSKKDPAVDMQTVAKKKKKMENKSQNCQEAQKSEIKLEAPKKLNSCLNKNKKKKALKSKLSKKSKKPDEEKIPDEVIPEKSALINKGSNRKANSHSTDEKKEQAPIVSPVLANEDSPVTDGQSVEDQELHPLEHLDENVEPEVETLEMTPEEGETETLEMTPEEGETETLEMTPEEGETETLEMTPEEGETETLEMTPEEGETETQETVCQKEVEQEPAEVQATCSEKSFGITSEQNTSIPQNDLPDVECEMKSTQTCETETETKTHLAEEPSERELQAAEPAPEPAPPISEKPEEDNQDAPVLSSPENTGLNEPQEIDEDEGIHSHDGSDISDNMSEGSDDSGLNGARSVQEETSRKALQEAAEAKVAKENFVCIFCDRSFKKEGEYSKHLNRHLVNVYYLEKATKGQE